MANDTHALPEQQLTQVLNWIHFGDSGEDERADDAIVKLTSATGRPICSLNAAWLKALAVASVEGKQSGPGSTEDERKALLQLLDAMPALAPRATGLSHAMRLVLLDALRYRDQQTAAAPAGPPARRAVVDAIAAYVGPTQYAEVLADRMFRLFEASAAVSTSEKDDARDATLWRWLRGIVWVGTNEDGFVDFGVTVADPEDIECLTDAERERLVNDSPDRKDMPALFQRIAEWRALPSRPEATRDDVPPEKARGCATKVAE